MKKKSNKKPIFVIQKHDATALHYDLRLEIGGTLKSWAVPKGPSTDPRVKRLALPTEDHAIEYGRFEGVIPEGSYGAGPVLIWDKGTYTNIKKKDGILIPMAQCYKDGTIEVDLHGKKLQGGYALVRLKPKADAKKGKTQTPWLLIKLKDAHADARRRPTSTQPESVVSGKTIEEIAERANKKGKESA